MIFIRSTQVCFLLIESHFHPGLILNIIMSLSESFASEKKMLNETKSDFGRLVETFREFLKEIFTNELEL